MNLALHGLLLQVIVTIVGIQNIFRLCSAGEPGYLDFDNLPETNFSCQGKVIGGYYADVEAGCQMFHVCTIGQKDEIMDIKFLCLNGTVFDQETRVCERVDEVDCSKSERFYNLNLELYGNNAVTLSLHESTILNSDMESSTNRHDSHHYYSSTRPSIATTTVSSTTTSTTSRPVQTTTHSNEGFRHPSGFQHQYYEPNFPATVQPKLYNEKHGDIRHQYVFHNNDRKNKNQATSYQLFSTNHGATSTTNAPRQIHQIRYSQSTVPQIIHSESYTISPQLIHGTSTIQTLLKAKTDPQNLIYHNRGVSSSTTEQYDNSGGETLIYDNSAEELEEDDLDEDDDGNDGVEDAQSQLNQEQQHGRRNKERLPLEAVQSTNHGKVAKLSIAPVIQDKSLTRQVILNTKNQTPPRITLNYISTNSPSTQRTTFTTPSPPKVFKVTERIVLPQIKSHQITLNVPSQDIQRIVHNTSPLLPSQSRVIVTAKASVSDESGKPLNASQIITLPTIPSSYDDYKEGDESFDPFYRDVPKINNPGSKTEEIISSKRTKRSVEPEKNEEIQVDFFNVPPFKREDYYGDAKTNSFQKNLNIIRAILFGLPITKDENLNVKSEDDYSEEVDSTKPNYYDFIDNNNRTNEREERDNRSPISQLLIKVSSMESNLPAERLNLPSGINDKILRSTSHENHHAEPFMSPMKLYIANTELRPKEETGSRKYRNQNEKQLNLKENFQERRQSDYYDDYSVEVPERTKDEYPHRNTETNKYVNNLPSENKFDDTASYASGEDYSNSRISSDERNRRISRGRRPNQDSSDYEYDSNYRNRYSNHQLIKSQPKNDVPKYENIPARQHAPGERRVEEIDKQARLEGSSVESTTERNAHESSAVSNYNEEVNQSSSTNSSESEEYEEYRSVYDEDYDYADNFSYEEKNNAKNFDFSETNPDENKTNIEHHYKNIDEYNLTDKLKQESNVNDETPKHSDEKIGPLLINNTTNSPNTVTQQIFNTLTVNNYNLSTTLLPPSEINMTAFDLSDYIDDNYEADVYRNVSFDNTQLLPNRNITEEAIIPYNVSVNKFSSENVNESEAVLTTTETPTTTPRPATNLYKPISLRKNYNFIPPTTTPNPVVIKPRLPLVNPNPVKQPKTYNELATKPIIQKRPLPMRRIQTQKTSQIHEAAAERNKSLLSSGKQLNLSTLNVPNVNLDETSTISLDLLTKVQDFLTTSTERAQIESIAPNNVTVFHINSEQGLKKLGHSTDRSAALTDNSNFRVTESPNFSSSTTSIPSVEKTSQGVTVKNQKKIGFIKHIRRLNSSTKSNNYAGFNCLNKQLYRFYSDYRDCRLFHYCSPGFTTRQVLDFRFVCEEGTSFDERTQSCRLFNENTKCTRKN